MLISIRPIEMVGKKVEFDRMAQFSFDTGGGVSGQF